MKPKKAGKVDIDSYSGMFFRIGIIISLLLIILAFEYSRNYKNNNFYNSGYFYNEDSDLADISDQIIVPLPPPPAPVVPEIKVVDNKTKTEPNQQIPVSDVTEQNTTSDNTISNTDAENENRIFTYVEEKPSFPGGEYGLQRFLRANVKYPESERVKGIQGLVIISFIIEKDGSISHIEVRKSLNPAFDAEAVRVIQAMPKWKPGKQRGKNVRVIVNIPLRFSLHQ